MSILSRPWVAAAVARAMQRGVVATSRRMVSTANARLPEFTARRESTEVPTSAGMTRVTLYHPPAATGAVHINLHGGGYVLPLTEYDDPICRALAARSGSVVLNVDYVVAPQHPFPAAVHQVHEVARWAAEHGAEHGWDGQRLTIGGQSAGGALAAAAARLAFEQGHPAFALQVLHYPPLDLSIPAASKRSTIRKPMLRPWMGDVFDTSYAPDPAVRSDRLISPAGAADTADLAGIAPAVVIAAEHDILRDEARRYADRLERVGALVEYRELTGADHGYDGVDDERARESYAFIADHIRRAVETPKP
ncbi:alpha/beta hydrolase [Archangium violaceum]|uniref:alpha/beta hydrolase n=1 Tax=Archangium violaceum TaxID=83451 RepID=UPI00194F973B|nr:alpha/beta hydrolase [Archangium violaceum]QRN92793.1 alpha/beta hydrolase [Archangium violaceum]